MKKLFLLCLVLCNLPSFGAIKVAASLPDHASIASAIGGNQVQVFSIAKSSNNPHNMELFPSLMAKVGTAQLYLKSGLSLDQWADELISGSRNSKLLVVNCSQGVNVLEKPSGKVDASMGDVHPEGNPHYWLDPDNATVIAKTILEALKKVDPSNSVYFQHNYDDFIAKLTAKKKQWQEALSPYKGRSILTYHSSWVYFAEAFHLKIPAQVEPLPGIPPTASHLAKLIKIIQQEKPMAVFYEPYYPEDGPKFLNRQTGIALFKIAPECDNTNASAYLDHMDLVVKSLTSLAAQSATPHP